MRLKKLNFSNSSSTYKVEQEKALNEISDNINKIGDNFDKFCDLENFILDGIKFKLTNFNSVRDNRQKIEKEFGTSVYLKKFKLASDELNEKLIETINEWDRISDISISEMTKLINDYKHLVDILTNIQNLNKSFETLDELKILINEFGRFKLIKIIMTEDISEKINLLIKYKNELIKENSNLENSENKKILSIDDL